MDEISIAMTRGERLALADLAESEGFGIPPTELAGEWVREHLGSLPLLYESDPASSPEDPRERLRNSYRPDDVEVLFVGESAPQGGSFFYQADSNLFRAVREACARAYGPLPEGRAFLDWFKDRHFWLSDLAPEPVNRLRGRPRKDAVNRGIIPLARLIRELAPDYVIAIKESIAPIVAAAADLARTPQARVVVLPFPLYQWRQRFIEELAAFFAPDARTTQVAELAGSESEERDPQSAPRNEAAPLTLHEAIARVLAGAGRAMSGREIANVIARDGLYRRGDGKAPPASQIAARTRKYPHLFLITPAGVALRDQRERTSKPRQSKPGPASDSAHLRRGSGARTCRG